jgi:LysM repeat protein
MFQEIAAQNFAIQTAAATAWMDENDVVRYENGLGQEQAEYSQEKAAERDANTAARKKKKKAKRDAKNEIEKPSIAPGQIEIPDNIYASTGGVQQSNGALNGKNGPYHSVQKGETLYAIANHYGTTVGRIKKLNNIRGTNILSGTQLKVGGTRQEVLDNVLNIVVNYSEGRDGSSERVRLGDTPYGDHLQNSWDSYHKSGTKNLNFLNHVPTGHAPSWFQNYGSSNVWYKMTWGQKAYWYGANR